MLLSPPTAVLRIYTQATVFTLLVTAWASAAIAQDVQTETIAFRIGHSDTTPTIDGEYSAAEWSDATLVELKNETHPSQNIPALVKTDVYVVEDGESLLLAFVA